MNIETRNNGIKDVTMITAESGKVLVRKGDTTGFIYGDTIWLGYSYYINGVKLDEPHLDTPDDFEEIDAPEEDLPLDG